MCNQEVAISELFPCFIAVVLDKMIVWQEGPTEEICAQWVEVLSQVAHYFLSEAFSAVEIYNSEALNLGL